MPVSPIFATDNARIPLQLLQLLGPVNSPYLQIAAHSGLTCRIAALVFAAIKTCIFWHHWFPLSGSRGAFLGFQIAGATYGQCIFCRRFHTGEPYPENQLAAW
ncbi:hypothetical protein [Endobacterium cereale]|uniref:hypothetical protein n=1 Tax=Endobacterium cereale TaxID=2663029 RepID=UPI002B47B910|nr:hypothetical protein [Endobacterium cereale]MEB2846588.1 hypothetical protein [Endobacterium cereale]